MSKITLKKFVESFKAFMLNAATTHSANSVAQSERYEATQDDSAQKAAQREATHARCANALAALSDEALRVAFDVANIETNERMQSFESQSRELKERAIASFNAIARVASLRDADDALDAVLACVASKNQRTLTLAQIQREMRHKTTTQARYFKTFAKFFDMIESETDDDFTLRDNNAMLNALLALHKSDATTQA